MAINRFWSQNIGALQRSPDPKGKNLKVYGTGTLKEGAFGGALTKQWFLPFPFFLQAPLTVVYSPLDPGIFPNYLTVL